MMALSSSLPDPHAAGGRRLDVTRTLTPVMRAIGLRRVARDALLGSAVGAAVGAAILVAAHFHTVDLALPLAIAVAAVGLLAGTVMGVARWPRAMDAARAADLHFGLDDRLTTALELRDADTPVAVLQSRDLERRIDGLALSGCRGSWLRRSEAGAVLLAALVFAGALALGPPAAAHHAAATTSSSSTQARHTAAKQVKKLVSRLNLGLTPTQSRDPAVRKLNALLTRLQHRLAHSSSPRASLRAISTTQQQLRQLAQGLHPVNARAVAQLNSSLSRYLNRNNTGKGRTTSAARSNPATAQALSKLAQSLSHLSAGQRAALARALAQTANATPDNPLRQLFRQAASSLANGQTQAGSTALEQASQLLNRSAAAQAAQARAGSAASQLNGLKSQVAGQSSTTRAAAGGQGKRGAGTGKQGAGAGKRGTGSAAGSGQGRGQGTRPGQGRGTGRGQGRGTGRGQGRGQRSGQGRGAGTGRGSPAARGAGRGTAAGQGSGGRGTSARTRSGRTVTVFVPGKQGKGATIDRTGPSSAPVPGSIVPYQQVVGRYAQSAHQALDRTTLPPSLQGYVRRYFSTLSR